jgi:hypothetical protein
MAEAVTGFSIAEQQTKFTTIALYRPKGMENGCGKSGEFIATHLSAILSERFCLWRAKFRL